MYPTRSLFGHRIAEIISAARTNATVATKCWHAILKSMGNLRKTYVKYLSQTYRERNLLALPTLDMYLPLSKFESIHRVFVDTTV